MDYKLYLDLDDTLADFGKKATEVLGTPDFASLKLKDFWKGLINYPDFFNSLEWLPDGKKLWTFCRPHSPTILTGIPLGNWAQPQKKAWCERELGKYVPLEMCFVKDKYKVAEETILTGRVPILVDDRELTKAPWEAAGGIFILHKSADSSIKQLKKFLK